MIKVELDEIQKIIYYFAFKTLIFYKIIKGYLF